MFGLKRLKAALEDNEEPLARVARVEYDLAGRIPLLEELYCQPAEEPSGEARKDRSSRQNGQAVRLVPVPGPAKPLGEAGNHAGTIANLWTLCHSLPS